MKQINVLIVDDSRVVREVLHGLLEHEKTINIVGTAENPFEAREMIKALNPDVITLDIEMPRMDGITFLKNLMRLRPLPVVMLSTLTKKGADITLEALAIGAIDFIEKPKARELVLGSKSFTKTLVEKITQASNANVNSLIKTANDALLPANSPSEFGKGNIIAIGASTGGTEAITKLLQKMPLNCPPIIISQHIPVNFSQRFASRLNRHCAIKVKQAKEGAMLLPGVAYIAPGNQHLTISINQNKYICTLSNSEKVNRHRPSVDVMFGSLIPVAKNVQAILLTGMGNDGANAMKHLKDEGAITIIQSQRTSLIWGMPGSAARINGHVHETDLENIPALILDNAKVK